MAGADKKVEEVENSIFHKLKAYGENSIAPIATATLIFAQHAKPLQKLPMLFPPLLTLSSYMHVRGYTTDAAGTNAAWSGLYILMALRRSTNFRQKFTTRGAVRVLTLGLCAANVVGGGIAFAFGNREDEAHS